MSSASDLLLTLRQYWGYSSFRPLQQRIIESLLGGHDTCVVMPTGGGKSLCYQLPAVVSGKTAIVISPLISLMQDQATQLSQMGISATVLNSTLTQGQQAEVMVRARQGNYRLLYISPERLARPDTIGWLKGVPLTLFAIDEAHCISEWGHEFRPEYRQLSCLRTQFPECPIAAFTASATRRVRHDILNQLQLRAPHKYIASFHRPNLRYVIQRCDGRLQRHLLLDALRHYPQGSVIVYSPTISRVEGTVDFLEESGIMAVGYHGQMESGERKRIQERWMSDEVRILVGTIAFGLGINKASVRAVIHLSLPKSIEQYYQEAGRAGRDGQPADCVLLWQPRDSALLAHFTKQISDPAERERAWQRYHIIRGFAESARCRHRQICLHFGETPRWYSCGTCDACGYHPEWLGTPARAAPGRKKSPVAPVVSRSRAELVEAAAGPDPELREYLREWRRNTAKRQGVPAFIVMYDTTLDDVCRVRPRSLKELRQVSGFGQRKSELYGEQILEALRNFNKGSRAAATPARKMPPSEETKRLLAEGRTLREIATLRGRQVGTVVGTIALMVEKGELQFQPGWVAPEKQAQIEAACARLGLKWLKPLQEALPADITFDDIRLVVARLRRQKEEASRPPATRECSTVA